MNPAPSVAILDVNETLSDLAPLAERFEEVGAPGDLLGTWFAATLRDGIALTAKFKLHERRRAGSPAQRLLWLMPSSADGGGAP